MRVTFSSFKPWLLAALAMVGIEVTYYYLAQPDRVERTNFVSPQFCKEESVQRMFVYDKFRDLSDSDPDILVVGDSSSNHGVIPHVVMTQVPGFKVVNFGAASNVGYPGYLYLAEYMLRRGSSIKYLVLYNTYAGAPPRKKLWDNDELIAHDIYNEFLHSGRRLLQVPTLAARKDIYTFAAYKNGRFVSYQDPLCRNIGYLMYTATNKICYGWSRETDNPDDFPPEDISRGMLNENTPKVTDETFFDLWTLDQKSYIEHVYTQFAEFARRNGVKLIVISNPMPECARKKWSNIFDCEKMDQALTRFQNDNPDVRVVPLEFWPDHKFSVFSHISTLFSDESALRLGRILKKAIHEDGAKPKDRPLDFVARDAPALADIDVRKTFCAFGWGDLASNKSDVVGRYIGKRDNAYLYTVVKPDREYVVRITLAAIDGMPTAPGFKIQVNDNPLTEIKRTVNGKTTAIDLRLPRGVASHYLGWLKLHVDIRDAFTGSASNVVDKQGTPGRRLAIRNIAILPVVEKQ